MTSPDRSSRAARTDARWAVGLGLATLLALGCNYSPYELAPVTGQVTIDGKPFTAGKVMFAPVAKQGDINSGKPGFGLLDEEGRFELSTYSDGDGAVVGKHWVMLYPLDDRRTEAHKSIPKFDRIPAMDTTVEVVAHEDNQIDIEIPLSRLKKFAKR